MTTRVYKYGAIPLRRNPSVSSDGKKQKEELPKEAIQELFKSNRLWNELVALHRHHRDERFAKRAEMHVGYAETQKKIAEKEAQLKAAFKAKRNARMKAGTKDQEHPLIKQADENIKVLKKERETLWAERKAFAKEADEAIGAEGKKALKKAFTEAVKKVARVENSQINSETANSIVTYFKTARDRAFKNPRAELQFHRFDGTGFWHYETAIRENDPETGKRKAVNGTSFSKLLVGNKGFEQDGRAFALKYKRAMGKNGKRRIYELRAKIAGGAKKDSKIYGRFDLILHRPLPDDAQIQSIKLNRYRNGDKFSYAVTFTLRLPDPKPQPIPARTIGVDLGFRKFFEEDGRIRIAAIATSDMQKESEIKFIELETSDKNSYLHRLEHIDCLKSRMDETATELGHEILPLLKNNPPMPHEEKDSWHKRINKMRKWPGSVTLSFEDAYKMARWLIREPEQNKWLHDGIYSAVKKWWKSNSWQYREMHNLRRKTLAERKEYYRKEAKKLVDYGLPIIFEKLDLSRMARVKDDNNKLGNKARYQRFIGSPSEFRDAVKNVASREGVPYLEVPAPYTSKKCSACGHVNKELRAEAEWVCTECGVVHDRDVNAAVNIAQKGLEKLQKEALKSDKAKQIVQTGNP